MISLREEHAIHASYLHRVLIECIDDPILSHVLAFKGGTCAAMLGYLDRFSVDLDFDIVGEYSEELERQVRIALRKIFHSLDLKISMENAKTVQFIVHYASSPFQRNSMKVSALRNDLVNNVYLPQNFSEINRIALSQSIETMVANKLVTPLDRYAKHQAIAGRDIYDIHHFLLHQYPYKVTVIEERLDVDMRTFWNMLYEFIEEHVSQKIVDEDLNMLIPTDHFRSIRKILIPETLSLIRSM